MPFLRRYKFLSTKRALEIKELLELQNGQKRSQNKELLVLGPELGPL